MSETNEQPATPSNVETVALTDGRSVDFAGKRKMLKSYSIEDGVVTLRFDFRNGETRSYIIPSSLLLECAGHGGLQKFGDETAGTDEVEDMVLAIDEIGERFDRGEWNVRREGGNSMAGTSILLRALVEFSGKSKEEIKTFLSGMTAKQKTALRNSEKVRPIIERLESERANKGEKVDVDSLLAAI